MANWFSGLFPRLFGRQRKSKNVQKIHAHTPSLPTLNKLVPSQASRKTGYSDAAPVLLSTQPAVGTLSKIPAPECYESTEGMVQSVLSAIPLSNQSSTRNEPPTEPPTAPPLMQPIVASTKRASSTLEIPVFATDQPRETTSSGDIRTLLSSPTSEEPFYDSILICPPTPLPMKPLPSSPEPVKPVDLQEPGIGSTLLIPPLNDVSGTPQSNRDDSTAAHSSPSPAPSDESAPSISDDCASSLAQTIIRPTVYESVRVKPPPGRPFTAFKLYRRAVHRLNSASLDSSQIQRSSSSPSATPDTEPIPTHLPLPVVPKESSGSGTTSNASPAPSAISERSSSDSYESQRSEDWGPSIRGRRASSAEGSLAVLRNRQRSTSSAGSLRGSRYRTNASDNGRAGESPKGERESRYHSRNASLTNGLLRGKVGYLARNASWSR